MNNPAVYITSDFSTYIYVIAGIVWLIVSIIKAANKKAKGVVKPPYRPATANPKPVAEPVSAEEDEIKKILEQLMGKTATPPPPPIPKTKTDQSQIPQVKMRDHVKPPPVKLDVHKEHDEFIKARKKKTKKNLENSEDYVTSLEQQEYKESKIQQHPPGSTSSETTFQNSNNNLSIEENQSGSELLNDFDLRKAVLYSEIFKRREY
jgi:hypothetical protein